MDTAYLGQHDTRLSKTGWHKIIESWASHMLDELRSNRNVAIHKCTDIETTEGLAEHVTAQDLRQDLFDKWLWHGGYLDKPWIEHTSECSSSTGRIMQRLQSMVELTGLPNDWWTILQVDSVAPSLTGCDERIEGKSKGRFKYKVHQRETMYQGDDETLRELFATDVGDATLNFAALGFVSMQKALVQAYASSWSVFALCEVGTDYQDIPISDLRYSWATSLKILSPQFCDTQWVREVYVLTLLGIVLRKAMGRNPYFALSASKEPLAWCAARVLHGGSLLAVGVELSRVGIQLDDKSRSCRRLP